MTAIEEIYYPGDRVEELLGELATWSNTTTIVVHGGSVFEFKGPFPKVTWPKGFTTWKGPFRGSTAISGWIESPMSAFRISLIGDGKAMRSVSRKTAARRCSRFFSGAIPRES